MLFIGICFFVGYYVLRSIVWHKIVGGGLPYLKSALFWEISEAKRYIPGNIWSLVGRVEAFADLGIPRRKTAKALITEAQLFVLSGIIVSLISLPFLVDSFFPRLKNAPIFYVSYLLALIGSVFVVFGHKILPIKKGPFARIARIIFPEIDPALCAKLVVIYIFSQIFFGLGTYFSVASFTLMDIYFLPTFVSFFVLSLLSGYLFIISPMGLGIREGMIAIGLSRFISQPIANVGAIFARLVLVASEMIFLGALFAIYKIRNKYFLRIKSAIGNNTNELVLGLCVLSYIVYFSSASILRHINFYSGRFDLGNMDQTVWNTMHGKFFLFTNPDGTEIVSRLVFHADFILVLISPLYFIWSDPRMLLLLQTIVLGLGAVFVYLIAKEVLKNKNISLVISASYLLYPALGFTNLYDFHAVALTTTFLLGAFYFMIKRKLAWFIVFTMLSGLTKEQVWAVVALLGLFLATDEFGRWHKKQNFSAVQLYSGIIIFFLSLAAFYFLIWHAIPAARGGNHFALAFFSEFGDSPQIVIKNILTSPAKTLETLASVERLAYLKDVFLPVGFLPLLYPVLLFFAVPDLGINLLSSNSNLHQIYYQYTAVITPFIFISTIYAVRIVAKRLMRNGYLLVGTYIVIVSLYSAYSFGPLPGARNPNIDMFTKQVAEREEVQQFLKSIPRDKKIAATNNLGAHLSQRDYIFTIPLGIEKADYVLFLLTNNSSLRDLKNERLILERLINSSEFEIMYQKGSFYALERRAFAQEPILPGLP